MKILKAVVVMSSKRKIFHGGKIKISNRIKQAADDCELSGFASTSRIESSEVTELEVVC